MQHVVRAVAKRQLAIRVLLRLVQQVVRRTVHRLEREVVLARLVVEHEEHVLAVLAPVPRDLPQPLVEQQRRLDLVVVVALQLAQIIVDRVDDDRAALRPEHGARRELMEHEQVELLARRRGGRAASLPRCGRGTRRGPPSSTRPSRRCAAAAGASRRRASTRGAVFSSLKCLRYDVSGTCGPRHRSMNGPSV